ncbi:hypothetical protein QC762_107243 [Podospora pseudocomata]|uniref:Uncharacterized protein n=1 Tax=Podospora pseudocomata TaxID=2093779 RepID=A0ABR0GTR8_9PEZI|nr:hypothetical protein QC762_107243 [Podospora pseudocomata]
MSMPPSTVRCGERSSQFSLLF